MNQVRMGTVISYIQTALNVLVTLFYTPVMIRLLGSSEYGLYNTVSSVIAMIALLNLGFGSTYVKYYLRYKLKEDSTAVSRLNGMFLCIFLVIALIAAVCGIVISNHLHLVFSGGLTAGEYIIAKRLMLLLTCNLAISLPANVFTCIITAHERFVFLKLLGTVRIVVSPLMTIPILLAGYGSVGMVVVTVAVSVICDLVYALYALFRLKETFYFRGFQAEVLKEICGYTALIALHLIVDQVNWNVDKILLGRFKGTEEVAIYSVGFSLYAHYITIGLPIINMFIPRVHKIVEETAHDERVMTRRLTELFTKIGRVQYLILIPIATGFIFFGKQFLNFWVGPGYEQAYDIALLLILPGSIDLIQNIGIEIQRSQNLHSFRAKIYVVMAAINVVISIILCRKYGAVGCAVGTAISLIVVQGIIINIYYVKKCHIDIKYFWKSILSASKGLIPALLSGAVICGIKSEFSVMELAFSILIYAGIYCVSMYYLGCNEWEKDIVQKCLRKLGLHHE